jgi:phospholipid/cholesterol/gamma-HCH transport system substrate-binding protein
MNERQMQFRVGVVMFATMIIGGLLATLNSPLPTGWLTGRGTYDIKIELPEAPGIGQGTPVRKSGLLIGKVHMIEDLDDRIVVHARIDGGRRLFPQYRCQVRTTVLGDATIDFAVAPVPPGTTPLADGATVTGAVVGNPLDTIANLEDDLQVTIRALGDAGREVTNLAQRVDKAFGDETQEGRVDTLLETTERAMRELGNAAAAFNDILGEEVATDQPSSQNQSTGRPAAALANFQQQQPDVVVQIPTTTRDRVKQALNDLPDAVNEFRSTMRQFNEVLESADRNFTNLESFTEPLGRSGEQIANSIVQSVEGLDKLVEEFTVLSQSLNNRGGTIGQLIHDPKVYENLKRLIHNANQVVLQVNDLTVQLKPVIHDARVFMDKVAREPGRVVTGGLNPSNIK